MATDNTVTLMGKLTDDPELRFTTNGAAVTNFRLPSPPRVHQGDQWTDGETRFFHITCWRQLADKVTETLGKGARAIVIGRLRLRSWETDDFGPDGQIGGLEAAGHLGQDPAGASIQPQDLPIGGQQPHAPQADPDATGQLGGTQPIGASGGVDAVQPSIGGRDPQGLAVQGQSGRFGQPVAVEQLAGGGVDAPNLVRSWEGSPDRPGPHGEVPLVEFMRIEDQGTEVYDEQRLAG